MNYQVLFVRKSFLIGFVLLTTMLSLASCSQGPVGLRFGYQDENNSTAQNEEKNQSETKIGFAEVNEKVFSVSCQACHSGSSRPTLTTYLDYKNNIDEVKHQVFETQKMPKNSILKADQINLLKLWIAQGAEEFGDSQQVVNNEPAPQEEIPVVDWKIVRDKVFSRCTACHFAQNEDGITDFTDREQVKTSVGSIYYSSVIVSIMPPPPAGWVEGQTNSNQLSNKQKNILHQWIVDGLKE
jgi:uncharacterized membrane protein